MFYLGLTFLYISYQFNKLMFFVSLDGVILTVSHGDEYGWTFSCIVLRNLLCSLLISATAHFRECLLFCISFWFSVQIHAPMEL